MMLELIATLLKLGRRHRPQRSPAAPRILVIRRNRLGDMIYTLPLLHALRRHYGNAHIVVACDPAGASIAAACASVNEVVLLKTGLFAGFRNGARLQNFDWVIAAKGGFDRRLARLTRLTNAAVRIGFARGASQSSFFTNTVALPDKTDDEHQIETQLRLLEPLGFIKRTGWAVDLKLRLPESAENFAAATLAELPFRRARAFALINLSSTVPLKFREQDIIGLVTRLLSATDFSIGLVSAPLDQAKALEISVCMGSDRVAAVPTPSPIDLAALMKKARFIVTPEGGAAHLAAAVDTAALVIWSEGPFNKWYSRGQRHIFVSAEPGEKTIPLERVWQSLQPLLPPMK